MLIASDDVECSDPDAALADAEIDCDDTNPDIRPSTYESTGDGIDEDCDGVEQCWRDADGDGFRSNYETITSQDEDCEDPGEALNASTTDCDDGDATTHLGARPVCDGGDHDCDGEVDQDCEAPKVDAGCGCATPGAHPPAMLLLGLGMLARRRPRARRSRRG